MKPIIFVNTHPIQYFAPLYKYLNNVGMKTLGWYCSDFSLKGKMDQEFKTAIKWDIPLLEGYESSFFRNFSYKEPSASRNFLSFVNPGLVLKLFRTPKSVIVVHGWNYFTHLGVILFAGLKGHTVCLRNDMPYRHELLKKGWKQKLKYFALKHLVFPRIDYFLYIGQQNKQFYESYGIRDSQLIFCPYAIDNERFRATTFDKSVLKAEFGIPENDSVVCFSAKYIEKKRPLDLLKAFHQLNAPNCWLLMVGEGHLRKELEEYIESNQVKQVILTGFINQQDIPKYYAMSDLFVMCSSNGENWGLSVNEAMNFNLPLVLSDLTGCAEDLVVPGENGYVFPTGDIDALTECLRKILIENALKNDISSIDIVDNYSFTAIAESLRKIV